MKIWKVRVKRRKNPHIDETRLVEAGKLHTAIGRAIRELDLDNTDGLVVHGVEYDNNKYMVDFLKDNPDLERWCVQ